MLYGAEERVWALTAYAQHTMASRDTGRSILVLQSQLVTKAIDSASESKQNGVVIKSKGSIFHFSWRSSAAYLRKSAGYER